MVHISKITDADAEVRAIEERNGDRHVSITPVVRDDNDTVRIGESDDGHDDLRLREEEVRALVPKLAEVVALWDKTDAERKEHQTRTLLRLLPVKADGKLPAAVLPKLVEEAARARFVEDSAQLYLVGEDHFLLTVRVHGRVATFADAQPVGLLLSEEAGAEAIWHALQKTRSLIRLM